MENKKNNKGLIWLIIILVVLVLGLVGFIVYDKLLNFTTTTNNNNETPIENTTIKNFENYSLSNYPKQKGNVIRLKGDILELAKNNLNIDNYSIIENYSNFDKIDFNVNDISFSLSCKTFDATDNICIKKSINLNDMIELEYEDYVNYEGVYVLITEQYYIIQYGNGVTNYGAVYIYDKNGKELVKTDLTTIYTNSSENESYVTIDDNKVYFVKHINCKNTLSYIDLKNEFKIVELDTESTSGINEC